MVNFCEACGKKLENIPERAYAVLCTQCIKKGYKFEMDQSRGTYYLVKPATNRG